MDHLSLTTQELEESVTAISRFIATQCDAAGVDGVVLGLSGGVDSATTAGLAAEALGPERVASLFLPADPTTTESATLAREVADTFELELTEVDVEPIVDAVVGPYEGELDQSVVGNVRARVRAVYWYLVANQENRLVLGGGNRTEWLTGYFTKFGDGAVDCLPLGDLYKSEVRQLARHIGVPEAVVTRSPTAELWADQTDEGELGIGYDTLDTILARYVDGTDSREELMDAFNIDPSQIDRVEALIQRSSHKRNRPPTPATA